MTARARSCRDPGWPFALCVVLACAGCSTPPDTEPAPAVPEVSAAKPLPQPEAVQPPKAQSAPSPPKTPAPSKGEAELERGIQSYEEGEYKTAARQLQTALNLGLAAKGDRAKAHKYRAFITCSSGREKSCRDEFGKALDADPQFELEPAEAGHPIWSAVLRSVRAERAAKAKRK